MSLDFSNEAWKKNLPSPGSHQAQISDIKFIPKDDITWMIINWELDVGGVVEELLGIDAPKNSPMLAKTAEGKRRINGLCEMLELDPQFNTYDDIAAAFIGEAATVIVALKSRGGMDEPVIRGVTAPKLKG
jgi:hypothetical protein